MPSPDVGIEDPMNRTTLVAALTFAAITATASATIITSVGSHLAVGSRIRTTTLAKPLDLDGDNAYGTAGWEFFGVGGGDIQGDGFEQRALIGLPSFIGDIASVPNGASYYAAYTGYALIDDPRQPIGPDVSDVISGLAFYWPATPGVEYPFFQIVVAEDAPSFRVGFLLNQEFAFTQFPGGLRLQSGDSQASMAIDIGLPRGQRDMYFFDVVGAHAGDVINVYATAASTRPSLAISGVTFDIPSPGFAPLALAAGFFTRRRR